MEIVVSFVMSLLLGMIPEVLFFTLLLINVKNLKNKKLKLFLLIMVSYILCIMLIRHQVLYYVIFMILIYLSLKILYKKNTQIIDVFIIGLGSIYLTLVNIICLIFVNESYIVYYSLLVINRILLFLPFIFKNKFNLLYKKYCSLWNRNDNIKRPIKSITLRNISLIALNTFVFVCNVVCLYILSLK